MLQEHKWAVCSSCGHKLMKIVRDGYIDIEIKCPACKKLIDITYDIKITTKED